MTPTTDRKVDRDHSKVFQTVYPLAQAAGIKPPKIVVTRNMRKLAYAHGVFSETIYVHRELVRCIPQDQMESVMGHEVAHFKLNHSKKRIGWLIFVALQFLVGLFCGFPWIAVVMGLAAAELMLYRFWIIPKQESDADVLGVLLTKNPKARIKYLNRFNSAEVKRRIKVIQKHA